MVNDVGAKLIGQFADNLAQMLTTSEPETEPEAEPVDLLKVTAGTASARRIGAYVLGALLAVLAWLAVRRHRRR
jgi:hypothetical protein